MDMLRSGKGRFRPKSQRRSPTVGMEVAEEWAMQTESDFGSVENRSSRNVISTPRFNQYKGVLDV